MEVSIIITCYNQEKYISRAIRSCLNQRMIDKDEFEVIVVDDGSTDHSFEIIKDFGNSVRYIRHKQNKGLPAARNTGIRKAMGRYIVSVDGDDFILKEMIAVESFHLNLNAHWGGTSCDYIMVDNNGIHIRRFSGATNPIACGVMFRKDLLIAIGLYDEKMLANEDKDLRLRFMRQYHIGHVELPLYRYRKHDKNLTKNKKVMNKYNKVIKKNYKSLDD